MSSLLLLLYSARLVFCSTVATTRDFIIEPRSSFAPMSRQDHPPSHVIFSEADVGVCCVEEMRSVQGYAT